MEKTLKVLVCCFLGTMLMQASCSDNDSSTTTPKRISGSFRVEEGVVEFLSGSMTISSEQDKKIGSFSGSIPASYTDMHHDVDSIERKLPVTSLAKKEAVLFGSNEEGTAYKYAKNQGSHQRILSQKKKESIEILPLTIEQKEALFQGYEKRKAKELQEKRRAAGCCFCFFLGAVLLTDAANDSKKCQTLSCFAPKLKPKMT